MSCSFPSRVVAIYPCNYLRGDGEYMHARYSITRRRDCCHPVFSCSGTVMHCFDALLK